MADRPIIFSGPMVKALLAGRKSQTRRVLKPLPRRTIFFDAKTAGLDQFQEPPYAPGDRLYVREAWTARMTHGWTIADARSRMYQEEILYRADGCDSIDGWWPSIHMPREFSRLTLTVTDVRVQRLQEISAADSIAEGVQCGTCEAMNQSACHGRGCFASIDAYRTLWNNLHGPEAWDANQWIAAYSFTVQRGNIDQIGGAA